VHQPVGTMESLVNKEAISSLDLLDAV